ncbi:hypothetical protein G7046_g7428 [Stylonectria norvegica]|nr:hypothetical protein G7046_g7428 [Stylonectria norvegica]
MRRLQELPCALQLEPQDSGRRSTNVTTTNLSSRIAIASIISVSLRRIYHLYRSTLSRPSHHGQQISMRPRLVLANPPPQSAQNSAGIQTLLDAEREASKIVQKAREFRTKRVREARDEAKREIAEYKSQKEDEYKKFEAEHSKGNEAAEDEANKEADKEIVEIQAAGKKGQVQVVKNLLNAVFDVKPVAPTVAA